MHRRRFHRHLLRTGLLALGGAGAGCATQPRPAPGQPGPVSRAPATGHPGIELPPPAGTAPVMHLPAIREERLAPGPTDAGPGLIVATRPDLPLVSVSVMMRCGSASDPPGHAGGAQLLAQLLPRGTLRGHVPVDAATLARQAEALGSPVETTLRDNLIALTMTVTTPRWPQALALLTDMLRQPLLLPAELQAARSQARDALALRLQDPALLATLVMRRAAWGRSPHGTVATPDTLAQVRRNDLVALHRRGCRPERVAVALAGDVDMATARSVVRGVLGPWHALPDGPALPDVASAPPDPVLAPTLLVHLAGAVQSSVRVGLPFVGLDAPDRLAGQLAAAVLGGGYSARLGQELRIRRGLTYAATTRIEQQRAGGLLVAEVQTEHRHAAEVAALMRAQCLALATQPPGEAELAARRSALLGTLARQLDTTGGLVAQLGETWSQGLPADTLARLPAQLAAIDADAVRTFAQRHWPAEALRTVVVGRIDAPAWREVDAQALRLDAHALALDQPGLLRR